MWGCINFALQARESRFPGLLAALRVACFLGETVGFPSQVPTPSVVAAECFALLATFRGIAPTENLPFGASFPTLKMLPEGLFLTVIFEIIQAGF